VFCLTDYSHPFSLLFQRATKFHAHKTQGVLLRILIVKLFGEGRFSKSKFANIPKLISPVLLRYCSFDNLVPTFHSNIYHNTKTSCGRNNLPSVALLTVLFRLLRLCSNTKHKTILNAYWVQCMFFVTVRLLTQIWKQKVLLNIALILITFSDVTKVM
jgi:hypothetical protein